MQYCCFPIYKHFKNSKEFFSLGTVCTQKNKTFKIEFSKNYREDITRIVIDDGLIKDKKKKCDFLFIRCQSNHYYFVELKSEDIEHAYNQIENTISIFNSILHLRKNLIYGFIVSTGVPKAQQRIQKLKESFRKNLGVSLTVSTNQHIERIRP